MGLSPELLQKDEAGQAKLNIGQALPQLMSLAGAFPGLVQLQMDPATKGMKMAVNNEVLKNVMSGIEVDPTKFIVSEDATGKNVKVEIDSENMRRIGDGLKAIVDKYKAQNGGAMQMSGDFGTLLQSLGGKVNISQKITDPVIVETTTDKVKLAYFVMNNSYWHVVVDVTDCKGKLKGVDKTGYFEVDGVKYPLKEVKEATIPASSDEVMTWDKNTTTQLTFVFPPVKVTANSQMELVLSTAKNGVRIKTHFRTNR